jgi:membrane protease YdiL (CAAX protease family)
VKPTTLRQFAPACIPYAALLLGLYGLRSAWAAVLFYYGGVIALVLPRRGEALRWFRGWDGRAAALLAGFGALGGALLYALWPALGLGPAVGDRVAAFGLAGPSWPVFLIYFALLNPVIEETLWRGRLRVDSSRLDPIDAAFAGYHILVMALFLPALWVGVAAAALILASWVWRRTTARLDGILVPYLSHAVADLTVAIALYLRV